MSQSRLLYYEKGITNRTERSLGQTGQEIFQEARFLVQQAIIANTLEYANLMENSMETGGLREVIKNTCRRPDDLTEVYAVVTELRQSAEKLAELTNTGLTASQIANPDRLISLDSLSSPGL